MEIFFPLALIIFAGIINGSFAIFIKYTKGWEYENIWFQWSLWALLVLPWIFALIMAPRIFEIYNSAPMRFILIMAAGGMAFGIGQICFAYAMYSIGLGLAFVLNIGIGTGLGFMLPLLFQYPDRIPTPFGIVTIIGTALAVGGIVLCTRAGALRDEEKRGIAGEEISHAKKGYWAGIVLAAIAGLSSAGQNFSFSETQGLQKIALDHGATQLGADTIMWPGFLLMALIPYAGYMLYLLRKNRTFKNYKLPGTKKYFLFAIVMALCWFGSLIFYSKASQVIGEMGPIVGWPLFMIFIILTSNFWGYISKEWKGASRRVASVMIFGLALMVAAVVALAVGSSLH